MIRHPAKTRATLGFAALLFVFLLTLSCVLLFSCDSIYITVSVKITVPDSETGFSGVIYENKTYSHRLGSPTVNGVLEGLDSNGKINYSIEENLAAINDFGFFDSLDNSYSRAWVVTINGAPAENGFFTGVSEGDIIEITYTVFIH